MPFSDLWRGLFKHVPTTEEIRVQLVKVERDHNKLTRQLEIKEQDKQEKLKQAMAAKKAGKQEMLRDVFRQLRQMELDNGNLNKDLRQLSLVRMALSKSVRELERAEKQKDRSSYISIIDGLQSAEVQDMIDNATVSEDAFNEKLNDILHTEEANLRQARVREDVGFDEFDRTIGQMVQAETGLEDPGEFEKFQKEIDKAIKSEQTDL